MRGLPWELRTYACSIYLERPFKTLDGAGWAIFATSTKSTKSILVNSSTTNFKKLTGAQPLRFLKLGAWAPQAINPYHVEAWDKFLCYLKSPAFNPFRDFAPVKFEALDRIVSYLTFESVGLWDKLFENDFEETMEYDQLVLGANLLDDTKSAGRLKCTCHFFTPWLDVEPVRDMHKRQKLEALLLVGNLNLSESIQTYDHHLKDDHHLRQATNSALRLKMTNRFSIKAKQFLFKT